LLEAAIRLFSARGYHAVSVDEIVAAAQVNKRMVYHYFGNKKALLQAALAQVYGRLECVELQAVGGEASPREKLTRVLRGYFEFLDQNPEFVRLVLWENLEKGRLLAKGRHSLGKNPFLKRLGQIVKEGVASGDFHGGIDIPHLLIHFIGLCFIYHSNRYSLTQSVGLDLSDAKVKARGLKQVLQLVFEGIDQHGRPVPGPRKKR
jgi:TetR/AcrR family transcriptional regulator